MASSDARARLLGGSSCGCRTARLRPVYAATLVAAAVLMAAAALCGVWGIFRRQPAPPAVSAASGSGASEPPSVTLPCGPVDGTWLRDGAVAAFRGIPYGRAPVGALRFQPPEPAGCWQGRLEASKPGPGCIPSPASGKSEGTSEDCLTLDVLAPASVVRGGRGSTKGGPKEAAALVPTVVWIYGGGLHEGSTTSYGALEVLVDRSAREGKPFILLAMNYRLGALGWAALPELAQRDPRGVAGNYGLLDQILALHWTQDHIADFGGDPTQVTVFGQSSGGTSIFGLLGSPAARGLFRGALSLSGSPNITLDRASKERQDREQWLPRTPCARVPSDALADCLASADAGALQDALPPPYRAWGFAADFPRPGPQGLGWSAFIYVDGVTIPDAIAEYYASGQLSGVSVLFEHLQCEDGNHPPQVANATAYLRENLTGFRGKAAAEAVALSYAALGKQFAAEGYADSYAVTALPGDTGASCGNVALAQAAARGHAAGAFIGTVVRGASRPLLNHGCSGQATQLPYHGFDLGFVMTWLGASSDQGPWSPGGDFCPYTPADADLDLVKEIWGHWLAFFTTGRPLPGWRDVRDVPAGGTYMHALLGGTPGAGTDMVADWKTGSCQELQDQLGVGKPYWWIN